MQLPKIAEQFAVVAPLFHLMVCAIFLSGYAAGFGAGIGGIFGLSDLFSISLSDLAQVYVGGFLLPIVLLAPYLRPSYVPIGVRLSESESPDDHIRLHRLQKLVKWAIRIFFVFAITPLIPAIYFAWRLDQRIPYESLNVVTSLMVSVGWMNYAQKLPTDHKTDLIVSIILCLFSGAFIVGLMRGQAERRNDFSDFRDHRMECGKMMVIRPVGNRFIALDSSGMRYVIDDQCKVILTIPKRAAFEQLTVWELGSRWWSKAN